MTTSSVGITASGGYCGNGPWFRRSVTGGPEPKSYLLQLWAGTKACALLVASSVAAARAAVLFRKSLLCIKAFSCDWQLLRRSNVWDFERARLAAVPYVVGFQGTVRLKAAPFQTRTNAQFSDFRSATSEQTEPAAAGSRLK